MDSNSISRSRENAVKELRVEVRLKNNRLIRLREQLGLRPKGMAEQIGVGYQTLLRYESLSAAPTMSNGKWRSSAIKIAAFHGVSPSYCWPDVVQKVEKAIAQIEVSADDAAAMMAPQSPSLSSDADPERRIIEAQLVDQMETAFEDLSRREQKILAHHYGLGDASQQTMQDIGDLSGCSRERIRQIECRALVKLKHAVDPPRQPMTDLDHVCRHLRRIHAVPHLKGVKARDSALEIHTLVVHLNEADRRVAQGVELDLRRAVDWCCMNPYCKTPWRTDTDNHTRGFQCCVPCIEQLSGRDRALLLEGESLDPFSGLRRWTQKARGRPPAGYCF